jgi:Holliday junction DNA helicase RuvA
MIAQLTGKLIHKSPQHLIVDVNGIGYGVMSSLNTFSALPHEGETITLSIHTYVREDTLTLYGFFSQEEKDLFQRLLAVSGIGPKVALAILSGIPPTHLVAAIASGDKDRLNAIPGVGKKTAERIILDLKDKLAKDWKSFDDIPATHQAMPLYRDALSALTNLGYTRVAAEKALKKIDWSASISLETAIRDALKELVPQ